MLFRPDPTFYPSPRLAMEAPAERLAYVVSLNVNGNSRRSSDSTSSFRDCAHPGFTSSIPSPIRASRSSRKQTFWATDKHG